MNFEDIKLLLREKFGAHSITAEEPGGLQPALVIEAGQIVEVCLELRDNELTYFDFLACLTGVHYSNENKFGVVYNLSSIPYKTQLTLKVIKDHDPDTMELPFFESVVNVWRTAEWHEREAYDLVGIFFKNHPDMRRILLPDDWEGFPLRKDYQVAEYYKGIKVD